MNMRGQDSAIRNHIENPSKLKQEKLEYLANLEKEKETNAKITQEVSIHFS